MYNTKVQQQVSAHRAKVRIALTKGESKAFTKALLMWQQEEKARKVSEKARLEKEKAVLKEVKQQKRETKALEKETKMQAKEEKHAIK